MPNFSYKALGRDGKEVRGVLQAESEAAAASRIRENYPILLSISQKKEKKRPDDGSLLEMEIGSRRIKTKKLAILCSQFAITLHSGMTVARAMRMLADQNEDKRIRKIMGAAAEEVAAGSTVASALEKYSDRFPLTFIETIRAGEQSGTLERSFDRLQKFYEKSYKTTEKIKGAMTYPLFVVAIAVVVLIIVMAKVIPTLADVFTDLGGTLPLMTRMLIATSPFLREVVAADAGGAGVFEDWFAGLWQYAAGADSESKDRVIPSTCGRDQPDERRSTVCQYNVGASGSGYHDQPGG